MKQLAAIVFFFFSALSLAFAGDSGYHQIAKYDVGGEGGWDYLTVDESAHRLYISRGTHVMVLDTNSGKVVGDIPDTPGVHGIAIARDLDRGFTSNGRDNSVTIFDLKTLQSVKKVKAGTNPDAIIYDPHSHRVFAFNGRSNDASVFEGKEGKEVGTVALGGKPEFAVSDGKGTIFVNVEDKSEIVAFDAKTLTVKSHWPLAGCEEPSGLAIDLKTRRLFSGCGNQKMAVTNADTGAVVTLLPIGKGVDANAFDPETKYAFSSNGDGTLTVVHEDSPDKFTVVENVATKPRARTMALDSKSHKVYLVTADFGPAPAPTADQPRPRPPMVPNTFTVLVFGK
jgi:DNA-binding beta-propeller fold protein YncE